MEGGCQKVGSCFLIHASCQSLIHAVFCPCSFFSAIISIVKYECMEQEPAQHGRLTREQKTGFVLLLVFGVLAVGLGFLQMRNTIYGPFVFRFSEEEFQTAQLFSNPELREQQIDTDRDGLTDYDERNFFETSPYLPDTDSDGIDDKAEVDAGTNPLCPAGQDCGASTDIPTEPAAPVGLIDTSADPLAGFGNVPPGSDPTSENIVGTPEIDDLISNPDQLRQLLLQSGQISAAELEEIDDQTLQSLAEKLAAQQLEATAPIAQ